MKKVSALFAFAVVSLTDWGCSSGKYHYVPNDMVIPALERQHDAIVSIGVSDYGGREIQAIYSPLKYTALMYNDMKNAHTNSEFEWERTRLQEGGIGGYYNVSSFTCSLLGGYGKGYAENSFGRSPPGSGSENIRSKLEYERWFLQPGFVLQMGKFRFDMALRQVWLRYDKGSVDVDNLPLEELNAIRSVEEDSPFSLTEFGLTLGFRLRPVTFSYNSVSVFGKEDYYERIRFAINNHNFMVSLNLHELWRKDDDTLRKRKNSKQDFPPTDN